MTTQNIGIRLSVSGEAQVKGALGGVERSIGTFSAEAKKAVGPLAGLLSAGATLGKLVQVQREFDVLNSSLKTVTGSSAAAAKEMEWIKQFAKETPFGLAQATQGFVKMKALGLDPSRAALTSFGNTASAMGKDLNQMIEAVADAATGEFERLKEFGVKSKKEGDQIKFTFQGVTTSIGNNAAEITKYLEGLGNNQFAGAMAERANTLDGAIASLGDTWDDLFRTVSSQGTGSLIHDSVRLAEGAVTDLTTVIQALSGAAGDNATQTGAMATVQEGLATTFEAVAVLGVNVAYTLKTVGRELGAVAAVYQQVLAGNWQGAKEAASQHNAEAKKAREEVDALSARILNARKVAALGLPNNYDEPAVIRARAAAEKTLADAKAATAKAAADAAKQEANSAAASKAAAAEAKKAAEADLDYRRRYTQELIKSLDAAAQAELAYQAAIDARKFDEAFEADQRHLAAVEARIKAGRTALEQIEFETELLALNTTEREVATAMRELERQGVVKGTEAYAAYAAKIQAAIRTREGKNAETKAADEAAKAWQKASEDIEHSLTDALMRGFESGKGFAEVLRDTVANMFKTLVLRPVIQATVQGGLNAIGLGGAGGILGAASNMSSLYNAGSAAYNWLGLGASAGTGLVASAGTGLSLAASTGTGLGLSAGASGLGLTGTAASGASLSSGLAASGAAAGGGMASIGAALPWIGAGLAVLSLIDSLDDSGTMHTGGLGAYSRAGGVAVGDAAKAQGLGFNLSSNDYQASTEQASAQLAQAIVGMLDSTAQTFGREAGYWAATGFADDVSSDGSWAALAIKMGDALLVDWKDGADKWPGREFADGEAGARQYAAAVALDVRNLLLEQTPGWADTMLNALGDAPSIEQLGAVVGQINMVQNALVGMGRASEAFAAMGEQATTALIAAMGGAEASVASLSGYYSDFYGEAERAEIATATLTADFAALGQELPASRLGLRAMIDAAIEAGDPALAGKLVNLSGRFAALVPTTEAADAALAKVAADMQRAFDTLLSSARASLASVADAESTVADLELQARIDQANAANEAARAMGDAAQSLRAYVQGQVATPQQQFADVLRLALQGDAAAMQALPSAATAAADAARANASTAAEAAIARARTLVGVNAAADLAQSRSGLVPVPTAESPMEAALRKLTQAIDAMAADVSSAISFDLANKLGEIDTSGNLAIEFDEFRTAFGSMASEATLAKVFATLDADGNGQITLLESINKNTAAMLTGIYQQMLGRAPDATGVAAFAGMTAAQIEAAVAASVEYKIKEALGAAGQANYIQSVAAGAPPDAGRLYAELLGRAIDPTGLQAFAGMSATQVEAAIKASPEYQQRIAQGTLAQSGASTANPPTQSAPASTASAFSQSVAAGATFAIADMYATLLGRAADPVGIQAFTGMSSAQIEAAIKASPEYQQKIRGYATGGYTGHGSQYEPAGIVHAGEVVWSQADVARWGGWRNVDAMRTAVPLPPAMPDWGSYSQPGASAERALVAEIQALRAEVQGLRAEARATAINTGRTEQLMKRVTRNGEAMQTEAAT